MDHRTLFKRTLSGAVQGYILEPVDALDLGECWSVLRPATFKDDFGCRSGKQDNVNRNIMPSATRRSIKEFREYMAWYDNHFRFWENEFETLTEKHAERYLKK